MYQGDFCFFKAIALYISYMLENGPTLAPVSSICLCHYVVIERQKLHNKLTNFVLCEFFQFFCAYKVFPEISEIFMSIFLVFLMIALFLFFTFLLCWYHQQVHCTSQACLKNSLYPLRNPLKEGGNAFPKPTQSQMEGFCNHGDRF